MKRIALTAYKVAFVIVAVAICMLVVGAYYAAAGAEHSLAYQAFRAWAFTNAGVVMLAIGCTIAIANFAWRRKRATGSLSV